MYDTTCVLCNTRRIPKLALHVISYLIGLFWSLALLCSTWHHFFHLGSEYFYSAPLGSNFLAELSTWIWACFISNQLGLGAESFGFVFQPEPSCLTLKLWELAPIFGLRHESHGSSWKLQVLYVTRLLGALSSVMQLIDIAWGFLYMVWQLNLNMLIQ